LLVVAASAQAQQLAQPQAVETAIWQLDSAMAEAEIKKISDAELAAFYRTNLLFILAVSRQSPAALVEHLAASDKLIEALQKLPDSAERLGYRAELHFEQGVVKLLQQRRWAAMWDMRDAYRTAQLLGKKHPAAKGHLKLMGLFEVGLASVPDQYKWLLGLLGYRGNMTLGFTLLQQATQPGMPLSLEAHAARYLATKFAQNDPDAAGSLLDSVVAVRPLVLARYLQATSLLDRHRAAQADQLIQKLSAERIVAAGQLPMVWQLIGRAKLYAGSYPAAREAYQTYLRQAKGTLLLRDAAYKIGLCYLLYGDSASALRNFQAVATYPESTSDEDAYATRYAMRYLVRLPDASERLLLQARYAFDGGYYTAALAYMSKLGVQSLAPEQRTEYHYRTARIYQFSAKPDSARASYQACLASPAGKLWMRVHACYYLGVLAEAAGRYTEAQNWYVQLARYKNQDYDYKMALEQRTEAALARVAGKLAP